MNRNLVYLFIFLVLLGLGSSFYVLALLGFLVLVPALLSPTRPIARRVPAPPRQEPRRIIPPAPPRAPEAAPEQSPVAVAALAPAVQIGTSVALFPMQMFPSLSQMGMPAQQATVPAAGRQEGRDELVEFGAILALLRLAFG